MLHTPRSELDNRIARLQNLMQERQVEGALIVQQIDLFYFTGTAQNAHLYVPVEGDPLLLVKKSLARAREESALANVISIGSLKKLPSQLAAEGYAAPRVLGLEMDVLPANNFLFYQEIFESAKIIDVSSLIRQVRQIKSAHEIDLIKSAARQLDTVFRQIPGIIREGMTELELAGRVEGSLRLNGSSGLLRNRAFNQYLFLGALVSGASCEVPTNFDGPIGGPGLTPAYPSGAGYNKIQRGQPIVIDYAGLSEGYIADQTRVFSLGPLPQKLVYAHRTALEIQEAAVSLCKPGVNSSDLHVMALKMAEAAGLAENFMGYGADQARFLGHGVGIELDEQPVLASGLHVEMKPGMAIALEPKFVLPGLGIVGIENTFVVTDSGLERITLGSDEIVVL